MAWLRAVPDPPEPKGSAKPPPPDRRSRMTRMTDSGINPPMPPVLAGHRFLAWLYDAGPGMQTGQGLVPLSNAEIRDWQHCNDLRLTRLEAQTLRELSQAFVAELNSASDRTRPAPYRVEEIDMTKAKQQAAQSMRDSLRAM